MSEEYEDQYTTQTRNELGQLVSQKNEDYNPASHKRARRNPPTLAGTSRDAMKVRKAVPWARWIPGSEKFLEILARSGKAEVAEIHGIDEEINSDPDITVIQTAELPQEKVDMILDICDEHQAAWIRMTSNKTSKRSRYHGYLRQKSVIQKYTQRLSPKAVLIIVVQSVGEILKPSREDYGRLLKSIVTRFVRLSNKINQMEKSEGNKYLKGYLARSKKGSHAYTILDERRVTSITEGTRAGDTKVAFDLEAAE